MKPILHDKKNTIEHGILEENPVQRLVHISIGKAILWITVIVASSFLAGLGSSLLVKFNISLSLPGRVDAVEKAIDGLDRKYMPLEISMEKWRNNESDHAKMEKKIDNIDTKIDYLIRR